MSSPRVSLLIACHNHEAFVEQALDSIAAQNFTDFELIITDDASTDGTLATIQRWLQRTGFPAELIAHTTNAGTCRTRNEALLRARGEFVCFLDADDWSEPHRLQLHVEAFDGLDDDVAMITGQVLEVSATGKTLRRTNFRHVPAGVTGVVDMAFIELLDSNFIPFAGVMLRRRCLIDVGGFDEALFLDDLDLWLRLASTFRFVRVEGIVAHYRVLADSISHSPRHFKKIWMSDVGTLKKWAGRSAETDAVIARRIRILAFNIRTGGESTFVDESFRFAQKIRPSAFWSIVGHFAQLPIAGTTFRVLRSIKRAGKMMGRMRAV